jgi:hypothetical protein
MAGSGRLLPFKIADIDLNERPLSGKADTAVVS